MPTSTTILIPNYSDLLSLSKQESRNPLWFRKLIPSHPFFYLPPFFFLRLLLSPTSAPENLRAFAVFANRFPPIFFPRCLVSAGLPFKVNPSISFLSKGFAFVPSGCRRAVYEILHGEIDNGSDRGTCGYSRLGSLLRGKTRVDVFFPYVSFSGYSPLPHCRVFCCCHCFASQRGWKGCVFGPNRETRQQQ